MSKRDIEIKITRDSRFNVAGLTVDTLDEAFDRYDKKMKREPSGSNWYFLTGVTTMFVSNKKAKEIMKRSSLILVYLATGNSLPLV